MEGISIQDGLSTAKGISEFGMLAMAAGFYLVVTALMMIIFIRWFVSLVNRIFDTQQKSLDGVLISLNAQGVVIKQVKEAVTGEVYNQVRVLMYYAFEFNKHAICASVIGHIKENNGLDNREAVSANVRALLNNLYRAMKTDIDTCAYNGNKLSAYCSDEWVNSIHDYCMTSIYDGKNYHRDTYMRGLDTQFERIKIEFFENLKKVY